MSSAHADPAVTSSSSAPSSSSVKARGAGSDAWCTEFSRAGDAITALGGTSKASLSAYLAKGHKLAANAPAAIKPDVEAMIAIDDKIVKGDTSAESEFANPATLEHIRHFATWLKTHCTNVRIDVPNLPSATG